MRKYKINSFIQIHKTTLFVLQAHTQIYHHCRIFLSLLYLELDHKSSQKTKINKSSHQPSPINSILNPQLQKVFEITTQKKKKNPDKTENHIKKQVYNSFTQNYSNHSKCPQNVPNQISLFSLHHFTFPHTLFNILPKTTQNRRVKKQS